MKLKPCPCPLCKRTPACRRYGGYYYYECACGETSLLCETAGRAAADWNRRAKKASK